MEGKANIKQIVSFAGAYVATIIGSGFATGQEIMQFFSFYGMAGIAAGIVSMVLFAFLGAEVLERGRRLQPDEPLKFYKFYCGKYFGAFLEWFGPLFLFGVLVIMISGAGATLEEYYGLSPYVGRVGMAIVALITVSLGLEKLSQVLGNIGPVIIVFTVAIGIIALSKSIGNLDQATQALASMEVSKPAPNWFVSGVVYVSYNMIVVITYLAGLGKSAQSRKNAIYGGILGGVALMSAAIVMHLAIFANIDVLVAKNIPALSLANEISPAVGKLFSIILLLGIYTTTVPLLWQVTNRFVPDDHPKFKLVTIIVAALGLVGGFLPFAKLVGTLYPWTGYLGIIILVLIVVKVIRLKGESGIEEMKNL